MEWNVVVIVALFIILALAGLGYKRGLVEAIWHLVSFVLILGITIFVSPYVAKFAKSNETIYNLFYSTVTTTVHVPAASGDDIDNFIVGLSLPEKVQDFILNRTGEYYGDVENAQQSLAEAVYEKLTDTILTSLAFIITFGLAALVVYIIFKMLDLASKLPVVHAANKLGGLAVGAIEGVVIVWIICGCVPFISSSEAGKYIIDCIYTNKFMKFLYEHNIFSEVMSGRIFNIVSDTAKNAVGRK